MQRSLTTPQTTSLGKLQSWSLIRSGLTGETTNGIFRVQVYGTNTLRITITRASTFEDFSYAVVSGPEPAEFHIAEQPDHLVVKTPAVTAIIRKDPVRFVFVSADGRVINEDDAAFGTCWNGEQVTTYKKLQSGERFIGLGEKTGPLDRRGAGYTNWNTDAFAFSTGQDPLYCSIPFYMGIHSELVYGIFFDNTHKSFFNFGASNNRFSSFAADAGEMDYYFMYDHSVGQIINHYTQLTGRIELPPRWSIGYQQCRYSYYPEKEVLTLAQTFRDKNIPADVIVLDIHYMDNYKIFTWSRKDFPNPKRLVEELRELGFRVVIMCDPGIKVEEGYKAYDDGIKSNAFLKYPDGTPYSGQVWPGWCHFPDFTNPETRQWWQEQFAETIELGVEGFWNDMNEIATWGQMLPENIELSFEGNGATMRRGRNVYGFQMARSTYEGTKALLNGKRPFNLTRSGFAGVQRYGAVWTGDNVAYDEHMMLGTRMVSCMGMSGVAFCGYDIGGFVGEASSRLFARWLSIGAFSPFFRAHTMINSRDSEPWAYGEEVEQISRNYIRFRYQLLPYIYSLFYDAATTGMPLQRSLAINYTHNPRIYEGTFQNQYLFGPAFLVIPVESDKEFVKAYLPEGTWFSLYNGQTYAGNAEYILECPLRRLPVFVKAGAIVPMQPVVQNTDVAQELLILHIYIGADGSFTYYDDDGSTFNYQAGNHARRDISYSANQRKLTLGAVSGSFQSSVSNIKLVFHGLGTSVETITVNGKPTGLSPEMNSFFSALEKFDPFYDPEPAPAEAVHSATMSNESHAITITW
ncbi:glycoside hydrolase family 31 protein [Chryseolinea sp. T2]|uniref:glycoside hydrolase family 31 protein n=1 Tax=Chryseolinea sp. T2 TaxID=3129255 RepID=UPI003076B3DD